MLYNEQIFEGFSNVSGTRCHLFPSFPFLQFLTFLLVANHAVSGEARKTALGPQKKSILDPLHYTRGPQNGTLQHHCGPHFLGYILGLSPEGLLRAHRCGSMASVYGSR